MKWFKGNLKGQFCIRVIPSSLLVRVFCTLNKMGHNSKHHSLFTYIGLKYCEILIRQDLQPMLLEERNRYHTYQKTKMELLELFTSVVFQFCSQYHISCSL